MTASKSAAAAYDLYHRLQDEVIADPAPYPSERFSGRGIVICAGGARLFACAWVAIHMLRRVVGCRLPIQVWHIGPGEMGLPMRALLEERGIEVVDAEAVAARHPVRALGGWELKCYAILQSRFEEVVLLDADNVPVVDPAAFFETAAYRETGALFWPDVVRLAADNPIWEICRLPFVDAPAFESGQIVVDKRRCWRPLRLAMHFNEHSDFYYRHIYGDKDTFHMAWRMLGRPFGMTPHPVKRLFGTLCQHDFEGGLAFQHRNRVKWILRGRNPRIEGFRHEEACHGFLAELRTLWDGRVFHPPPRSAAACALEASLAGRRYRYAILSAAERELDLLPGHRVGGSGDPDEQVWFIDEREGRPELVIGGDGRVSARLGHGADGLWRGRREILERAPVELAPVAVGAERIAPPRGHSTGSVADGDGSRWRYRPTESG